MKNIIEQNRETSLIYPDFYRLKTMF